MRLTFKRKHVLFANYLKIHKNNNSTQIFWNAGITKTMQIADVNISLKSPHMFRSSWARAPNYVVVVLNLFSDCAQITHGLCLLKSKNLMYSGRVRVMLSS